MEFIFEFLMWFPVIVKVKRGYIRFGRFPVGTFHFNYLAKIGQTDSKYRPT